MTLKNVLIELKTRDFIIENLNINELVNEMLSNIGTLDFELRDDLIHIGFENLIANGSITDLKMKEILKICLDNNHLFYKIGEDDKHAIYTRSFSLLLIPQLLDRNLKSPFLDKVDIKLIKEKLVEYANKESDFSGYSIKYGWAHAAAHLADSLEALLKYPIDTVDTNDILDIIKKMVKIDKIVYQYLEEERLIRPFMSILKKNVLEVKLVLNWLHDLSEWEPKENWNLEFTVLYNVRNFFSSLYFIIKDSNIPNKELLLINIEDIIKKIMGNYR